MDTCRHCGDVIMYCKCYEKVIEEYEAEDIKLLNKAKELATIHHEGQTANMEKC